jgi:two-component system cell cycle response regulator DivK
MHTDHARPNLPHIVIADSHEDSRDLYAEWLTWHGFRVTAVATGAEAVEVVRRETPDAIVASIRLQGVDGFAMCDALQATPRTARIPVIALSTCTCEHARALRDRRFAAVLLKPCLPDVLLDSLQTVLAAGEPVRRSPRGRLFSSNGASLASACMATAI